MSSQTMTTISLVARREFTSRVATKAFIISSGVIVAVIIAGLVIFSVLSNRDNDAKVAVAGQGTHLTKAIEAAATVQGTGVDLRTSTSESEARKLVADDKVDIALIAKDNGSFSAVSDSEADPELQNVITAAVQNSAMNQFLEDQGVDPGDLQKAVASHDVKFTALNPSKPDKTQRMVLAYVSVFLLFFAVYLYGMYVAMGVVEEKSSRVVELLLATIKPLHLLLGKVIGIGAVGLLQVLLFTGVGLLTAVLSGVVTVGATAAALFFTIIVWYLLGYAFFAVLNAALGSLVSRQEDVNSAVAPLSILAFAMLFAAQGSLDNPDATWVQVLTWIPPFSATLMPMRVASGVSGPFEFIGTIVVMIVALSIAAIAAARIYENSILNVGGRQSLKKAYTAAD